MASKKHISRGKKGKDSKYHRHQHQKDRTGKSKEQESHNGEDDNLGLVVSNSQQGTKFSIWLFFMSSLVAIGAVCYRVYVVKYSSVHVFAFRSTSESKTSLSELFDIACERSHKATDNVFAYCNRQFLDIKDETRTIVAAKRFRTGQKLLQIPRSMQITTIDALRHPKVRELLMTNPRHPITGKPLHPKAYLAVHMALEFSRLSGDEIKSMNDDSTTFRLNQVRRAYLDYLPKHQDFAKFHPLVWNNKYMAAERIDDGPASSLTDHLVRTWRWSMESEYRALCRASLPGEDSFGALVSMEDWVAARLVVNTRSFDSDPDISDKELEAYRPFFYEETIHGNNDGEDEEDSFFASCRNTLMRSCMVPLLDALDHHKEPNVQWNFLENDSDASIAQTKQSFVAYAARDVDLGAQLLDSYGSQFPDPTLFAQYGFVNSDRSGSRAALLAAYHRILDTDFEDTTVTDMIREDLQQYLAFQDGYQTCYNGDASRVTRGEQENEKARLRFQEVKFKALSAKSNLLSSWSISLPPRRDGRLRLEEDDGSIYKGIQNAVFTCRLLAMTHRDFGGKATEMLETIASADHPEHYHINVSTDEATRNGLEFRTWHVMTRLAEAMRSRILLSLVKLDTRNESKYNTDSIGSDMDWEIEVEISRRLESGAIGDTGSPEWARTFVLLGELEALSILREHSGHMKTMFLAEKQKWSKRVKTTTISNEQLNEEDFFVRQHPCK